ncbi:MAG: STAS domain-containing protein [Candidatus Promineifilaceae bacterium]
MKVDVQSMKRVELVTVTGRIDSSNAPDFDAKLMELTDGGEYQLVLNLSGVEYTSSAGLRALVSALRECKKHNGDLRLSDPSERVKEVLELAGLASLFEIFDDDVTAVGSF